MNDIAWLIQNVLRGRLCVHGTEWYLFGSVIKGAADNSDIDILILYESRDQVISIKEALAPLDLQRPLDLRFMSYEEERSLNFRGSENCVEFFPRNELGNPEACGDIAGISNLLLSLVGHCGATDAP